MRAEADRPAHRRVPGRRGAGRLLAFGGPAADPRSPAPSHVDHRPLPLHWLDTARRTARWLSCARYNPDKRTGPRITPRISLLPIVGHEPQPVRANDPARPETTVTFCTTKPSIPAASPLRPPSTSG